MACTQDVKCGVAVQPEVSEDTVPSMVQFESIKQKGKVRSCEIMDEFSVILRQKNTF